MKQGSERKCIQDTDQCAEERIKNLHDTKISKAKEEKLFCRILKINFLLLSSHSLLACCHLSFISFVFFRAF
jgi:hypothetical protein